MMEYLKSEEVLKAWQGKSLIKRAALLNAKFAPVKVSVTTLRRAYLKLGIKKKKVRQIKEVPEGKIAHMRR